MKKTFIFLTTAIAGLLFTGCYYSHPERLDPWDPEEAADIDSMAFRTSHHYWKGFNFEATDTLRLATRPPTTTTEDAAKEKLVVTSEAVLLGTMHDMSSVLQSNSSWLTYSISPAARAIRYGSKLPATN